MAKIIFLVTEDWYFWSHRVSLARTAKARGHEVVVATRVQDHGELIRSQGFTLLPIALRRRSASLLAELASIWELVRIYRRERPDLVHHVAIKPIIYGSIAARIAKVGAVVNAITGLGYVFINKGWKASIVRFLIKSAYRVAFSLPNCRVIFQNPQDMELFVTGGILQLAKATLIRGSGVDTRLFSPRPPPDRPPTIIMASRMLWDKGVGELVAASRRLKGQGVFCRVILVGRPDPDSPASIPVETLEAWHRDGVVTWLGHRTDIPELLRAAHIAVLPSYREGLPKGLLEAAACGLPLVATDVPGCREIVRPGSNGLLVPPRDPVQLALALRTLVEDQELCLRMGQESRRIVGEEFTEEKVIEATLSLYRELLKSRGYGLKNI